MLKFMNEVTVDSVPSMAQAAYGSSHSLARVTMNAKGYPASAAPIVRQDQLSILSVETKSPFFGNYILDGIGDSRHMRGHGSEFCQRDGRDGR